ncbi:MAG TPA: glycosyltransferase [Steroidobacteraceae bacterium]|nr:glycosyltransferase [Steroidobacteraceae bacterium]
MAAPAATKVLHLVNGEFYAGAERVQDLLALQLAPCGFDVSFACLKDGVFALRRRARQAALYPMPMRSRFDIAVCLRLARLVRAEEFRLLHTHTPRTALIGRVVSLLTGRPMVHHVHSPAERDTEQGWRNVRNNIVENYSLRGASRLIAVSGSLEEQLRERGFSAGRVCQIPNGVPIAERSRREYQPGQELTLGMIALYRPRKGIEVLLEAMSRMRAAGARVRLHAVGPFETPEYERTVLKLAGSLGLEQFITWAGFRTDVNAEFRQMHLFVLPSLYGEGMPMVVLEAMAAGLPVVSTRVEGIPQVIRHGQDGLLSEPGDPDVLANTLLRFVRGEVDSAAMGDSGWLRQREKFSDVSMAAGVAAVYRGVLET